MNNERMKPIFEDMPKMTWVMSIDSREYRYKQRLEKWVMKNKKQLSDALATTEKALKTAKNPTRVAWLWQRKFLQELLGEKK